MKAVALVVLALLAGWRVEAQAAPAPIHVDCASRAAAPDGSVGKPFNSLDQLNARRLQPGARILFKRGATCYGSFQPAPGSSGTAEAPIVVGTYGAKSLPRPVIAAGCRDTRRDPDQAQTEAHKVPGTSPYYSLCDADSGPVNRAALHLLNVEYWEINGLELTNDGLSEGGRVGLLVQLEDFGTGRHYRINDVYVHHVRGYLQDEPGRALAYKATGGILFAVTRDQERPGAKQKKTSFDDVVIENSEVYHVDGIGVSNRSDWMCRARGAPCGDVPPYKGNPAYLADPATQAGSDFTPSTGMVIRNNKIHDIGGDGLIVRVSNGTLVEANLLYDIWMRAPGNSAGAWAINTNDAVFRYNEVHHVRYRLEPGDGMAFDADMGTWNTRFHANYSHDNQGGMMLFCACGKDGLGQQAAVEQVVVDHNLSVNDGTRGMLVAGLDSAVVKHNVMIASGDAPLLENAVYPTRNVLELSNNQFVNTSESGVLFRTRHKQGNSDAFVWQGNSFAGYPSQAGSVPAAERNVKAMIEQWFKDTGFRQHAYRGMAK